MAPPKRQPFDGHRGDRGIGGWWINAEEAKERAGGKEEWWKKGGIGGMSVLVGPADEPFWLFENGDMYLGEWGTRFGEGGTRLRPRGVPVEHGLGITYNNSPTKCKGMVFTGEWQNGHCRSGKSLWLESSPTWQKNYFPGSPIRQEDGKNKVSRPFIYSGDYDDQNLKSCKSATVTLKDGTRRVGPWQDGKPVGDFWNGHRQADIASTLSVEPQVGPLVRKPRHAKSPPTGADRVAVVQPGGRTSKRDISSVSPEPWGSAGLLDVGDDSPETRSPRAKRDKSKRTRSESVGPVPQPIPSSITSWENSNSETEGGAIAMQQGGHFKAISKWLAIQIGFEPDMGEMDKYAHEFIELGLHSVDKIVNSCKATDVAKFNWMPEFHKRDVIRALLDSEPVADRRQRMR